MLSTWTRWGFCLLCMASSTGYAAENTVQLDLSYIGEGVQNIHGGANKGSQYLGAGDLIVTVDTAQAGWWQGGTWLIEALLTHGQDPSARFIGDIQTASNIAASNRTRLQQFWYQQEFGDHVSLLLGLHDLNSEFYVSEYASWFLHSSFGIGPEISGNVGTSLWPEAGWAARLDMHSEHMYLRMAAYDGNPATRAVDLAKEGLMSIAEWAYLSGASAYKLGAWRHSANKAAPDGKIYTSDSGIYGVVDQEVGEYVGLFLQLGLTQGNRNDISNYMGAGVHIHGFSSKREDDVLGIAVARAGFDSLNKRLNHLTSAETTVEITYDMPINHYISIHPAFQWIQHPSGNKGLPAASVAMLRIELHL